MMTTWFWLGYGLFAVFIAIMTIIDLESDSGCLKVGN